MAVYGRCIDLNRLRAYNYSCSGGSCASWDKALCKRGKCEGGAKLHSWVCSLACWESFDGAQGLISAAMAARPWFSRRWHREPVVVKDRRGVTLTIPRAPRGNAFVPDKAHGGPWARFARFARDRRAPASRMHTTSPSTVTDTSPECTPTRKLTLPDPQGDGDEGLQPPSGPRADVVEEQRPGSPRLGAIVPFIHARRRLHFI